MWKLKMLVETYGPLLALEVVEVEPGRPEAPPALVGLGAFYRPGELTAIAFDEDGVKGKASEPMAAGAATQPAAEALLRRLEANPPAEWPDWLRLAMEANP